MQETLPEQNHLWSIILAGGEGKRTRPFIRRWLGRPQPKQYCAFIGTRSVDDTRKADYRHQTRP